MDRAWEGPAPVSAGRADDARPASARWYSLVVECASPRQLADFWLAALGWTEAYAGGDEIAIEAPDDPEDRIPAVVFWRTANPRTGKNRLHLDLSARDLTATVDRSWPWARPGPTSARVPMPGGSCSPIPRATCSASCRLTSRSRVNIPR